MRDLQTDLRDLARGLTSAFERWSRLKKGGAQSQETLWLRAPPAPPAGPLPQPDLQLDVDLPLHIDVDVAPAVPREHPSHTPPKLLASLRDKASVRDAFVLKEILDRPRAVRPFRRR